MGGVVSGIGNAVGGVGKIASGVAGAIPGAGKVLGPVVGGITGGPVGFATSLASQAIQGNYGGGGGGGSSGGTSSTTPAYAQPSINYGNNTYQYGNTPIDASKYFITGDRGVYNLLPALGNINAPTSLGSPTRYNEYAPKLMPAASRAGAYTPYEAYNDIATQMANDPTALNAFKTAYTPEAFNFSSSDALNRNISNTRGRDNPFDVAAYRTANPFPMQNVNFNLQSNVPNQKGLDYNELAKYAAKNQNPFFMPFESVGGNVVGFTPSTSALAKDTSIDTYNKNLNNAINTYYSNLNSKPNILPRNVPPRNVPPRPVIPAPVAPTSVTPTPVTTNTVTPPVLPPPPGNFVPMAQGGIATLRRK